LFGLWSQFFFTQPGDAEMLAEAFDCILSEGVADANRENRIDDTQGQVVDAVLFGLRGGGQVEIGFTVVNKNKDFGFSNQEVPPGISKWWVSNPP